MIQKIKRLRNIGTFDKAKTPDCLNLKKLTLIHAENGRGKTTLAAIVRSLATDDPQLIIERQRIGSSRPPNVVLGMQGPISDVKFGQDIWHGALPDVKIFDDVFVDRNIHSGLRIEAHHGQSLHELILGEKGVSLNSRYENAVKANDKHNEELRRKSDVIPKEVRGRYSVEDFCELPHLPDIDELIEKANRTAETASNEEAVRSHEEFETIELPEFDIEAIELMLRRDLTSRARDAEGKVKRHIQALGEGGESWVEEGYKYLKGGDEESCPFCNQSLVGLDLIAHYQDYFSREYDDLKRDINDMITDIDEIHGDQKHAKLERTIGITREKAAFWASYLHEVPTIDIDTEAISRDWKTARELVSKLLQAKEASPLKQQPLGGRVRAALDSFHLHRQRIGDINSKIAKANIEIGKAKRLAGTTKFEDIQTELKRLNAIKARHSDVIAPLCEDYLQERRAKERTIAERTEARNLLEEHRETVFPETQVGVNRYLESFNAGFRLERLRARNTASGSGSTCSYHVSIRGTSLAARNTNASPGDPTFRSTLSAGDRNALALSLFFSSLDLVSNLGQTIVVIDDPISSLDDHRTERTAQVIRELSLKAGQVIVLSHNRRFLCTLWNKARDIDCCSLEINRTGDSSTIQSWNVSQDNFSEHDNRNTLFRTFVDNRSEDKRTVRAELRNHLEAYFRTTCPDEFPLGVAIGRFINNCRAKVGKEDEILTEKGIERVQSILDYANPPHHAAKPAWQTENINTDELLGFVKDTLNYIRPAKE